MTSLRGFFKRILASVGGAAAVPSMMVCTPEEIEAKICDTPPPMGKNLVMECGRWKVRIMVTSDILIPVGDGQYSTNPYRTWFKVIGEATNRFRHENKDDIAEVSIVRFEGPTFERANLKEQWAIDVKKILDALHHSNEYPKLVDNNLRPCYVVFKNGGDNANRDSIFE